MRATFVATILLVILAASCSPAAKSVHPMQASRVVTVEVGGMTCSDCVGKIEAQLARVPGVRSARVDLKEQRAHIECAESVKDTALTNAVRRAGPDYVGFVIAR